MMGIGIIFLCKRGSSEPTSGSSVLANDDACCTLVVHRESIGVVYGYTGRLGYQVWQVESICEKVLAETNLTLIFVYSK